MLGKGGFAGVYRVRNLRLQRTEALKVLSDLLTDDADFAKRFEQEARVAAALDHPNIVKIYDYGSIEGFFWFSMQFIDGVSVGKELKNRGRLEDTMAARIVVPVLDALAYSHERGVIHRDIKPDNILLDRTERPYLTDFGVAKSELALVKTHAGTLLGSPAYMSPEQLQGKALDGRSDLYSVGVTLYKMLSGALPFTGEDTFRATMKRLSEDPLPLSSRRPEVHPVLDAVVMRALERMPEQRFPDAASMRDELEGFLAEVTPVRTRLSSLISRPDDATPTGVTPARATTPTSGSHPSFTPSRGTVPPDSFAGPDAPTLATPAPLPAVSPDAALPPEAPPGTARPSQRLGWVALASSLIVLVAAILIVRRPRPEHDSRIRPSPAVHATAPVAAGPSMLPTAAPASSPVSTAEPEPTAEPTAESRPTSPRTAARPTRRSQLAVTRSAPTRAPAPTAVPTSVPAPPTPVTVEPGKRTPPQILEQAPLVLPRDLLVAHHNESIGLVVVIAADGSLKSARVISPVCPECDRAALDALRRFRFRPAMDAKGNPVEGTFGFAMRIP